MYGYYSNPVHPSLSEFCPGIVCLEPDPGTSHEHSQHVNHFWIDEGLPATELKIPNKEGKCEALTQQVLGAVCVVVVVIGEMVDSVTAALIDACKRRKIR